MANDINKLAERIKRIDKDSKLSLIYEMMLDFNISSGDIVEFCATKGSVTINTAQRLREINQARKSARKRLEEGRANTAKARAAKVAKKEERLSNALAVAPVESKPKLSIEPITLEGLVDD